MELDREGWVNVEQLLASLKMMEVWSNICEEDLQIMINNSLRKRHEILNGKIRAMYGHSLSNSVQKEEKEPPENLYHGTSRILFELIKKQGLVPSQRQYVHLTTDIETALQIGKRRDSQPIIISIDVKQAWNEGVKFYQGNDKIWLADSIPSKYINRIKNIKIKKF